MTKLKKIKRLEGPFNPDPITRAAIKPGEFSSVISNIFGDGTNWRLNRKRVGAILAERGWQINPKRNAFMKGHTLLLSSRGFEADPLAFAFFKAALAHSDFSETIENASDERINEALAAYNAGYSYASLLAYEQKRELVGAKEKDNEARFVAIRAVRASWLKKNPNKKPTHKEIHDCFVDPCASKPGKPGPKKKLSRSRLSKLIKDCDSSASGVGAK
jgi:hypothetical protein